MKRECLNYFLCFSLQHLDFIVQRYVDYYNELRPHQGKGNRTLTFRDQDKPPSNRTVSLGEVKCRRMLGGVLKHYYRVAA